MKKARLSPVLVAPLAVAVWTSPARAQSAAEVFESALERYEASVEGIDRYTTVQEVMGMEVALTFEKQVVDGHPVFVPVGQAEGSDFSSAIQYFPQMAERARMEGREEVGGEPCYVVTIDDFTGLDFGQMAAAGQEGEFTPREGTFFIDTDSYLMRKMALEGDVETDGEVSSLEVEAHMQDWRQVEGMWHPFLVTVRTLGAIPGMSEEDMEEARQAMAEMEEQLAEMPASQRAMAERMMGGQMERLQEMLESGTFEMTIVTKEVRVNEGS